MGLAIAVHKSRKASQNLPGKKKKTGYYTENDEKNEPGKGKGPVKEPC